MLSGWLANLAQGEVSEQPPCLASSRRSHRLAIALDMRPAEKMNRERHRGPQTILEPQTRRRVREHAAWPPRPGSPPAGAGLCNLPRTAAKNRDQGRRRVERIGDHRAPVER